MENEQISYSSVRPDDAFLFLLTVTQSLLDALSLWDSTLCRLCFSVCRCNMLTSWLPSHQRFSHSSPSPLYRFKMDDPPYTCEQIRSAPKSHYHFKWEYHESQIPTVCPPTPPWILHVFLPTVPQYLRYLCFNVVVHLRSSTFEACFLPSSFLSRQHVIPSPNTKIDNLLESSSHNCAKPVIN